MPKQTRHLHRDYHTSHCGLAATHIPMTYDPQESDCGACLEAEAAAREAAETARADELERQRIAQEEAEELARKHREGMEAWAAEQMDAAAAAARGARASQPKSADLVGNYTTTEGVADFVLGEPVDGFKGFVEACQVGDCFYYSAVGIDHHQREIGRGTLLEGGVILRDPISGVRIDFSAGKKALVLVPACHVVPEPGSGSSA